jgi:hypothetical protein
MEGKKIRKRDASVLVMICAFAVLCAGALRTGGNMRAKALMCTMSLEKIGQAMSMYISHYDGRLPLLERYSDAVPSIESTYLMSKSSTRTYLHLGCLYGAGYLGDGELLFCPATPGWRGELGKTGQNSGTYLGAVHATTGKFMDITPGVSQPNQGWKVTRAYCYWPLSKRLILSTADLMKINVNSQIHYNVGLPYNATKADDLNASKPIVTDCKFHYPEPLDWMVNCLHPDGHVTYQPQPKATGLNGNGVSGTWGMYSMYENCQLPSEMINWNNQVTVTDPVEKGRQLAAPVTPTEFAWALQP